MSAKARPGPVHLELPEDIAGGEVENVTVIPVHAVDRVVASAGSLDKAAEFILEATRPLGMFGAAGNRPAPVEALSSFVRRTQLPFFNTVMGKGAVTGGSSLYMGTACAPPRFRRVTTSM